MAITLAEAKNNATDDVDVMVIDEFRKGSAILDALPFDDVVNPAGGVARGRPHLRHPRAAHGVDRPAGSCSTASASAWSTTTTVAGDPATPPERMVVRAPAWGSHPEQPEAGRRLLIVLSGECAVTASGETVIARAGDLLLVEDTTGTGHSSSTNTGFEALMIVLD